jgi:hypothetical protein
LAKAVLVIRGAIDFGQASALIEAGGEWVDLG